VSYATLDMADLTCEHGPMSLMADKVYGCVQCDWCVSRVEFLRNYHGTAAARQARIRNREIGRPLSEVTGDSGR
jgi:hypothetical protein